MIGANALGLRPVGAAGPEKPAAIEAATTARDWLCHIVDRAAAANRLPASFLTRVLWQESRFRTDATSPAGAEGVAQFMPQTAAARGLLDPREPGPAISHAAQLLSEYVGQFGNLGLAAAAYNAGETRVARWLQSRSDLPTATRLYVLAITGRRAEDWAALRKAAPSPLAGGREHCLTVMADLAGPADVVRVRPIPAPNQLPAQMADWQVRLDNYLAKAIELKQQPPGTIPPTRSLLAAAALCDKIREMGSSCEVYDR